MHALSVCAPARRPQNWHGWASDAPRGRECMLWETKKNKKHKTRGLCGGRAIYGISKASFSLSLSLGAMRQAGQKAWYILSLSLSLSWAMRQAGRKAWCTAVVEADDSLPAAHAEERPGVGAVQALDLLGHAGHAAAGQDVAVDRHPHALEAGADRRTGGQADRRTGGQADRRTGRTTPT